MGQHESRRQQHCLCSLCSHSVARRKTDEEDINDFQDVGTSGGKSRRHGEDHEEVEENGKVSALSSQLLMYDISRPFGLALSIKRHAKLTCAYLCVTPTKVATTDLAFVDGGACPLAAFSLLLRLHYVGTALCGTFGITTHSGLGYMLSPQ